ncbi:MAG: UDP-N-acetylmuramate--L-alanine ligase, partial [Lachnospiraceae bacterium]|nr:UDP-N-acetylmuramate--L-alanine ligase [Lachnospiraceae bacterium]
MYQIDFNKPCSIYFIGIGGISMSGLAELLQEEGFRVSGSDWHASPMTKSLEEKGVLVKYGESSTHITDDIDCAVLTSAVHEDNLEFQAIKAKNIPYMSRGELLGQVMKNYALPVAVSGTHGKTTTTSMISEILLQGNTDPTLFVGGILKSIGGNLRIGKSDYFVTEACEYTNSFLSFFPKISLILNIDEDHLDFFKDLADIRNSFRRFAEILPADGTLIINGDIENYQEITEGLSCRVVTFGHTINCDYALTALTFNDSGFPEFTVQTPTGIRQMKLQVPGEHNVINALASLATADLLGIDFDVTAQALYNFHGTNRRFEYKGSIGGVTVIDDYAHHPTEITATLQAATNYPHKTLWCVFQPHTYTRTKALMADFAKALTLADRVVLTDIYAAREKDNLGISSRDLQKAIQDLGKECAYFPTFDEVENFLLENCINGDLLITMGAGDVHKIG